MSDESIQVQIGRFDERLKSLENKTDDHHKTILSKLKDIEENINPRLSNVELRMYAKSDFSEFYKNLVEETKIKEDTLKEALTKINDKLAYHDKIVYAGFSLLAVVEFYFRVIK